MFMPIVKCKICSTEFYVKPSHQKLGYGQYCSRKCHHIGMRKGKYVKCCTCDKITWKPPKALNGSASGKFFCSKSCQTIWRNSYFSGPLHPNWVDGKNKDYRKIIKKSEKPQQCKICGNKDTRVLVVHHLDKQRVNNSLSNLEWLCHNCHYLVHKHGEKL